MNASSPTVKILTPSSRESWLALRKNTLGSSEIPALLGLHPQSTAFEVFALKTGRYERPRSTIRVRDNSIHLPPLERGNFMEEKGFELARMLRPAWSITPNTIPGGGSIFQDAATRLSSTPDAFLTAPDRPGRGALQIKTIAQMVFDKGFKDDVGEAELPGYIAVQAIVDAWLSGCEWACAGLMVANFCVDFYLFDVPLHQGILSRVLAEAAEFWRRVETGDPYPPDYARDGDALKRIYADDDGGTIDLSHNERALKLVAARDGLKRIEGAGGDAAKERKVIDAEIVHLLGNAACGILGDGRTIEAKTVRVKGHTVPPNSYRSVKIKGKPSVRSERSNSEDRSQPAPAPDHF